MNLKDYLNYSTTFIETGTCHGDGVKRALDAGFTDVRSVEFSDTLYSESSKRFITDDRVKIYFGKSYEQLPAMLKRVGRCVFFLDAHPAGPATAGHLQLISGDQSWHQDSIITKELKVILAHRNDHVIIIDDQQGDDEFTRKYLDMARMVNSKYHGVVDGKYFILITPSEPMGGIVHSDKPCQV